MPRTNAIIERLKISPCTVKDLPYKPGIQKFSGENRMLFQKIHMSGHRYRKSGSPHRQFVTVYYVSEDIDRAVDLFVKINYDALSTLNFTGNNILWSGMPKNIAKKIVAKVKTFKVLSQKVYKV